MPSPSKPSSYGSSPIAPIANKVLSSPASRGSSSDPQRSQRKSFLVVSKMAEDGRLSSCLDGKRMPSGVTGCFRSASDHACATVYEPVQILPSSPGLFWPPLANRSSNRRGASHKLEPQDVLAAPSWRRWSYPTL